MNSLQKRFVLFLVGCMGARSLWVYLASIASRAVLKAMAVVAAAIALGFAVIYAGGLRQTGLETGGAPIWWNQLRPVHAALYASFAYSAWTGNRDVAWRLLLVDVLIGFVSFCGHHSGQCMQ